MNDIGTEETSDMFAPHKFQDLADAFLHLSPAWIYFILQSKLCGILEERFGDDKCPAKLFFVSLLPLSAVACLLLTISWIIASLAGALFSFFEKLSVFGYLLSCLTQAIIQWAIVCYFVWRLFA